MYTTVPEPPQSSLYFHVYPIKYCPIHVHFVYLFPPITSIPHFVLNRQIIMLLLQRSVIINLYGRISGYFKCSLVKPKIHCSIKIIKNKNQLHLHILGLFLSRRKRGLLAHLYCYFHNFLSMSFACSDIHIHFACALSSHHISL